MGQAGVGERHLAELEGVLERITYANEETGYTVARVATRGSDDLLTVVGNLLGAQPGESLRMQGRWTSHPQYGRQFSVSRYQSAAPGTLAASLVVRGGPAGRGDG